jgi:Bacterial membrane protein YfhO
VLDRANIGFIGAYSALAHVVDEAAARRYQRLFGDGFVTIFQRATEPRFFFSSEYRVVSKLVALEAIASAPSREIVLEQAPAFTATPNRANDPEVTVERYGLNSVILIVDAPRPGLVHASESFFDGWTARVNGVPSTILAADYAFRAVAVPAGRSRIEFRYWPPGLTAGLMITGIGITGLVVWLLIPPVWLARRREQAVPN